ncbi:hypothetical protein J2S78_001645 [Salibacterium salarium]|uniref:hypothetical protein n=1 Tax=Salibacterium salarium TaxID=284579 RepID=UPI002780624D|nr:hypothetical protein [Salibacterium salarium]MDQ0299225.1 hypothetical protein [Salibacterium salarium]
MISKIKELSSQEWAILILFIFSIIALIATVEWVDNSDLDSSYVHEVEDVEDDVITYKWTSN